MDNVGPNMPRLMSRHFPPKVMSALAMSVKGKFDGKIYFKRVSNEPPAKRNSFIQQVSINYMTKSVTCL